MASTRAVSEKSRSMRVKSSEDLRRDRDRDRDLERGHEKDRHRSERREDREHDREKGSRDKERSKDRDKYRDRSSHDRERDRKRRDDRRDRDRDRERDRERDRSHGSRHKPSEKGGQVEKVKRSLQRSSSDQDVKRLAAVRDMEASDQLTDDEAYSSEEEVEEEGKKVTRLRRSQSINREALAEPKPMEGWMGWWSERRFFKAWKRYYFHLEYPFINFFSEPQSHRFSERPIKPKGSMSMRGSCLVDDKMEGDKRASPVRFRLRSSKKEWIFECDTPETKAAWVTALRAHIQYANPAKREQGVDYMVTYNDDSATQMRLNISLRGLTLTNTKTGRVVFQRRYQQLRALLQPKTGSNQDSRELVLDFCEYGGAAKTTFQQHVLSRTIHNLITGIIATHVEWMNCPGVLPPPF